MSIVGKKIRLNRIFNRRGGKALIVAIDHGIRFGVLRGLENPLETTRLVVEGGADAIMATPATSSSSGIIGSSTSKKILAYTLFFSLRNI